MAVMLDMIDAKNAMAVVSEVTAMDSQQCLNVVDTMRSS